MAALASVLLYAVLGNKVPAVEHGLMVGWQLLIASPAHGVAWRRSQRRRQGGGSPSQQPRPDTMLDNLPVGDDQSCAAGGASD